ncbi:FAD-dependent monooxygenase [Myceligenerans xiligouense]|uniref:2-polyprenyl-6-methoxyphenol hydroxylase-like FAD-dependent oxidoreductase n=1 Tax=Myceligenerans xiligouense TaxID=253184 RepID=A0A3N4YHU8_9MICO|nr:FAD-dependent monooxygenase [Myceligenerans xiligouense]RPF19687.1 2-polyprenyl-6-methoxyphenol hydroxylase-like FAD-dependent oxidoreductase [Myceligenerans xiligouense]
MATKSTPHLPLVTRPTPAQPEKSDATTVAVVGAGPTGLLLAGDLAEAGIDVTILEKRSADLSNLSRAFGVHARTLEMLDMRGIADELMSYVPSTMDKIAAFGRAELDLSGLPTAYPYLLICSQTSVERVLRDRLHRLGVTIRHDTEVTGLDQDPDGVSLTAAGPDGEIVQLRTDYAVGCDGVRSTVRDLIGLPFPGGPVMRGIMLADVVLADPPPQPTVQTNRHGFAFVAPFGDGYWRLTAWSRADQADDDAPLTLGQVSAAARQALGTDYGMHSPRWISRFHSDERQVPEYRVGRVFLAGDAAHCHTPAGGQGMNTGIQDAANLSWRLAAVTRGADPDLLDGYHADRHPVGAEVLRSSGRMARIATTPSRLAAAVRGAVAPLVLSSSAITKIATMQVSGLGIEYGRRPGDARTVGTRVPDRELPDGTRMFEHLRNGRFALIGGVPPAGWSDRVSFVPASDDQATLVRPDGHVAWAGTPDGRDITESLRTWCGKPSS